MGVAVVAEQALARYLGPAHLRRDRPLREAELVEQVDSVVLGRDGEREIEPGAGADLAPAARNGRLAQALAALRAEHKLAMPRRLAQQGIAGGRGECDQLRLV